MAYRDGYAAPRIAELEALIAEEPAVQVELRALRIRHGDLVDEADRVGLAAEQARAAVDRPGVLARLFGGAARRQAELARLDDAAASAGAAVAASVEAERVVAARLGAIEEARVELAQRSTGAAHRLRDEAGPDGDAYRAHDRELAAIDALMARIRTGLTSAERADDAARSVRDAQEELAGVRAGADRGGVVGLALAAGDAEASALARLHDTLVDLAGGVDALATALAALHDLVPDAPTARLRDAVGTSPIAAPPDASPLLRVTPMVTSLIDTTLSLLQVALTVRTRQHEAIAARQLDLAAQAVRR